jgi:16S rRNA (guanine527-N7)-methyltransferase
MFHVKQDIPGGEKALAEPALVLRTICRKNGLVLSDEQIGNLGSYVERLLEWNKTINLISRRDEQNIWFSHILHSLSPLFYVEIPPGFRVLDLGSGGGLPGIPLAIARGDISVLLLDSIRKKTTATADIAAVLHLDNVAITTGRAEEFAIKEAGRFDLVLARAVASLEELCRWSKPLVRKARQPVLDSAKAAAPHLLALKGGDLEEEIRRAGRNERLAITVIKMVFEGSLELGLEDKKLVLVNFS